MIPSSVERVAHATNADNCHLQVERPEPAGADREVAEEVLKAMQGGIRDQEPENGKEAVVATSANQVGLGQVRHGGTPVPEGDFWGVSPASSAGIEPAASGGPQAWNVLVWP